MTGSEVEEDGNDGGSRWDLEHRSFFRRGVTVHNERYFCLDL